MKEEEIRERIERFLKKAARNAVVPGNVVVPASVGLSLAGAIRVTREVGLDVAINTTVYRENCMSIVRTVRHLSITGVEPRSARPFLSGLCATPFKVFVGKRVSRDPYLSTSETDGERSLTSSSGDSGFYAACWRR